MLDDIKHEPLSTGTEVTMENVIFRDLPRDLSNVELRGIKVELLDVDFALISIYSAGAGETRIKFSRGKDAIR